MRPRVFVVGKSGRGLHLACDGQALFEFVGSQGRSGPSPLRLTLGLNEGAWECCC